MSKYQSMGYHSPNHPGRWCVYDNENDRVWLVTMTRKEARRVAKNLNQADEIDEAIEEARQEVFEEFKAQKFQEDFREFHEETLLAWGHE